MKRPLPNKKEKKKKISIKPYKKLSFWFLVSFLVSAGMFAMGILVGRDMVPVHFDTKKLKKDFAYLKKNALEEDKKKQNPDLIFYDTLKSTKDEKKKFIKKKVPEKNNLNDKILKKNVPLKSLDNNKNNGKVNDNRFTIQVASVRKQAKAQTIINILKKKGYSAYTVHWENPANKITWRRIRIGFYKNKTEAERIIKKLKQEEFKPLLIKIQ